MTTTIETGVAGTLADHLPTPTSETVRALIALLGGDDPLSGPTTPNPTSRPGP